MKVDKTIPMLCKINGDDNNCIIKGVNNKLFKFFHWNINKSNSELDFATINAYIVSSKADVVNLNETLDQTRISLSFNTFMFGVLGEYDHTSELILKQGK